jgi:hypothetical protein
MITVTAETATQKALKMMHRSTTCLRRGLPDGSLSILSIHLKGQLVKTRAESCW